MHSELVLVTTVNMMCLHRIDYWHHVDLLDYENWAITDAIHPTVIMELKWVFGWLGAETVCTNRDMLFKFYPSASITCGSYALPSSPTHKGKMAKIRHFVLIFPLNAPTKKKFWCSSYKIPGGNQASMSPRCTEWLRGAENYTHFFHKKINISTTIYSFPPPPTKFNRKIFVSFI